MIGLLITLLLLLLFAVVWYTWQRLRKEVHLHVSAGDDTPSTYSLPAQSVSFTTEDGISIGAWYIPAKKQKAIVILVHGRVTRKGGKAMMLPHAKYLYENGYTTLLLDMRGVGESSGTKVTFGMEEWKDVVAAYTYAKSLPENKDSKIGLFGISMGAATSLIAAGQKKIGDFVIADVPYSTYSSLFAYTVKNENVFPKIFFRYSLQLAALLEFGLEYELYTPLRAIAKIVAPVLFIAAKKDVVVNPKDVWQLFEHANQPKDYWEANASHDVFKDAKEAFTDKVLTFLDRYAQ